MHERYEEKRIVALWSDEEKIKRWDQVELAAILARVRLEQVSGEAYDAIAVALRGHPVDVAWWKKRDEEIGHDLNAYLDERRRWIPVEYQSYFHEDMTSYDTEEPAFAIALAVSNTIVSEALAGLFGAIARRAKEYRYLPTLDRTHGQWAKLKSLGARMLDWHVELEIARKNFRGASAATAYSRMSGAVGNYGGKLTPEIETEALKILGLTPFYGATQIMPRIIYAPLAHSMSLIAEAIGKMAHDIRLMARSGLPLVHEPFSKKQKGSSAMPHKKNPILSEKMEGMRRMAVMYASALQANCQTWEARAIEQSSVERVAWSDLYHVVMHAITVMTKVIGGMVVYPDNAIREIIESRGTYASDEAKNFLAKRFGERGIGAEEAYRIIQLASFSVFSWMQSQSPAPKSLAEADEAFEAAFVLMLSDTNLTGIRELIGNADLETVAGLNATEEDIGRWRLLLLDVFSGHGVKNNWDGLFKPSFLLRNEDTLFAKVLGGSE